MILIISIKQLANSKLMQSDTLHNFNKMELLERSEKISVCGKDLDFNNNIPTHSRKAFMLLTA